MSDGDEPADDAPEQPDESENGGDAAGTPETEASNGDQPDETTENEEADDAEANEGSDGNDTPTEPDTAEDVDGESTDGSEENHEADDSTEADADEKNGSDEADEESNGDETEDELVARTPEAFDERLDGIEADIEAAETEADLDAVESDLADVHADIEDADLPEPDEDEEDATDPREELGSRVTELEGAIEEQRGPYVADAIEGIEGAQSTITETRWTEQGEGEVVTAVETFLDSCGDVLDTDFAAESEDEDDLVAALDDVRATIEGRDFDPDEDDEPIAALLEATDALAADLDDAEEWDDLSVRRKLDVEGFYDVLTPETRKDFPPEWNAIKIYEKRNEPAPILRGLGMFDSEFMQGHCIESLKRMGSAEAYEAMEGRAQKRDKSPIEVLGKIGDERALDTLHEYIEGDSDPALQKVTIKAIGEVGSTDSTQPVADRLVAENDTVRSNAARALGLIGDTRAIAPLSDVLADDDSDPVRASAAWALNQIGTEDALDAAREHAADRSFLVQTEAEKAERAVTDDEGEATESPA